MENYIDDFINFLIVERNLASNTIEAYASDLVKYINFLLTKDIENFEDVHSTEIVAYLTKLHAEKISSLSIARNLSAIRMFHRFLMGENVVKFNPTDNSGIAKVSYINKQNPF